MTKSGFDIDELERRLMLHDPAWWRMNTPTLTAYETIPAMIAELRELRAENVRLKDFTEKAERNFRHYGDLHAAKPDMDKAKRNYDMADEARAALGEPQ